MPHCTQYSMSSACLLMPHTSAVTHPCFTHRSLAHEHSSFSLYDCSVQSTQARCSSSCTPQREGGWHRGSGRSSLAGQESTGKTTPDAWSACRSLRSTCSCCVSACDNMLRSAVQPASADEALKACNGKEDQHTLCKGWSIHIGVQLLCL